MMTHCWLYDGTLTAAGYGQVGGWNNLVHRLVYEALVGPIPAGLELDHLCRNRSCYNPAHLEPVTHAENCRRGARGRLVTKCAQGHPYDDANTYWRKEGRRMCRTCHRERERLRYRRIVARSDVA